MDSPPGTHIVVIVGYHALPGKADAAGRAIRDLVSTVLKTEPECLGISILEDPADPSRITLVERWPDRDLFLGTHMQQPHIQAFIGSAGAFLAGPPDISFWRPVDAGQPPHRQ